MHTIKIKTNRGPIDNRIGSQPCLVACLRVLECVLIPFLFIRDQELDYGRRLNFIDLFLDHAFKDIGARLQESEGDDYRCITLLRCYVVQTAPES